MDKRIDTFFAIAERLSFYGGLIASAGAILFIILPALFNIASIVPE